MSMISKLVPVVLLVFFLMIATTYSVGVMSSADENMNVTAEYQDQYNHSVGVQTGTLNIMSVFGMLVGLFALVIVLIGLKNGR